ncbi:MAG: branched-chain amino acid ABC transporter permease [Candidatus Bathyarchaeales archaeon]
MIDIIIGGAILGAIFSLIAIGLNLQYGVTRILNIAHGEFLMLGAYVTYLLFTYFGVNPLVSLAISGPTVFVIGVLIQLIVFRKLVNLSKSAEELEFRSLLACFGLQFILQNVVRIMFGATPIGVAYLNETIPIFGELFKINMIVAAFISITISIALYLLLRLTRIGLAMRAAVEEPTGAQLVGINILKIHSLSFGLGVLISALAGSMICMIYTNTTPYIGPQYTFIALAVIILGGMGSFIGSLLGGFLIGYIYYASLTIDPLITMAVVYAFLIVMLILKPKGLLGR